MISGFMGALLAVSACQPAAKLSEQPFEFQQVPGYTHDVIGMQEAYLEPEFWLRKLAEPNALVLNAQQIEAFNTRSYDVQPELVRLSSLPESVDRKSVV